MVLAVMCLVPAPALGQERRELSLGAEAPVTLFADRVQNLERERLVIAEGRVEIEQGDVRLEAERVEVNTETGEAVATGRVVFFDGRDRLVGERLEYNFRTGTGVIYQAEAFVEPHFFFLGNRMERFGEKAFRLAGGVFTTCEGESPAWHVRWGEATAYLDDWVWGTNASFWIGRVPIVPFIPFFAANLRKQRSSGLLVPTFGSSSAKGLYYQQPIYWVISDSQDLTLTPTYYGSRGWGLGAIYRYVWREESRGEMEGFGLQDTRRHEGRWVYGVRHEEQFTPKLTLKADIAQVSDDQYFSDFGNTLDEQSKQRLDSNISLTQRWEKWNLVNRLGFYEDLTTDVPIELNRLPELKLNAFSQPVPGLGGLLYELETSYNNFVRDVGSDGQRFDIRPVLSFPFSAGGYVSLTPRLAGRETVYDTKVIGIKQDRGFFVENTVKEAVTRSLFEAALDLETRAYRVFDLGGAMGIQRLQHAIEPRLTYNYIPDVNQDNLPQYDGTDKIRPTNGVAYSLTNRIKARSVSEEEGKAGRVWELARLTLSQSYDLEQPPRTEPTSPINQPVPTPSPAPPVFPPPAVKGNRLSDLTADFLFEPVLGIQFRANAVMNVYDKGRVSSATTDLSYEAKEAKVTLGTRHGDGGRLQFVQGTLTTQLGPRWVFRFSTNYDIESGTIVENRFEVDFREQCWATTLAYVHRTSDDEFRVTINLLELGHYGFGRVFASQ
jgi:LPS-assembly protein